MKLLMSDYAIEDILVTKMDYKQNSYIKELTFCYLQSPSTVLTFEYLI